MLPVRTILLITLLLVIGAVIVTLLLDSREGSAMQQSQIAAESGFAGEDAGSATEAFNLIIKRLLLFMVGGIAGAILLLSYVIPFFSDVISGYFYAPTEKIGPNLAALASAKIDEGDYEGAISDYRKLMEEDPADRSPVDEIAKVYQKNLENSDAAIAFLKECLSENDWEEDDAASLMFQIVSIELDDRQDPARAREYLELIVRKFQGPRHGANAAHRIEEIDSGTSTALDS